MADAMAKFWETAGAQAATAKQTNARLEAALSYLEKLQWAVVPLHWIDQGRCSCGVEDCRTPGKHPHHKFAPHGVHSASKDAAKITEWYTREPRLNVGIATGETSGFVVLDVDPRNGGDDTLAELEKKYGKLPDTACAITGGGGQHFLFTYTGQRVKSPGKGLDVKSNGGLIVVAPSMHQSGNVYQWEGIADPLEGAAIVAPPLWIIDAQPVKPKGNLSFLYGSATGYLDPTRIAELRNIFATTLHADDSYTQWVAVGQALHSTDAPEAFELWDEWSQLGTKYKNGETQKKWATFTSQGGLNVESIFAWARDAGWKGDAVQIPNPVAVEHIAKPNEKTPLDLSVPSHLLSLPGALGTLVNEINRTAPKKQPQFAVVSALALGAVVCSRIFMTTNNNFSSLYFLEIGQSGCGKEYGRKVIEKVLGDAKLSHLIGPSDYHSASAIYSELLEKPAHIAIIDEFGAVIRFSRTSTGNWKGVALEFMKTLWGQLDGIVRPVARSTLSLTTKQKNDSKQPAIFNPGLCLLGMGTPKQFYEALTPDSIEAGFLGRLIIVQTNLGRMDASKQVGFETPQEIIDWCAAARDGEGNLASLPLGGDIAPTAKVIPIHDDAWAIYERYDKEVNTRWESLERQGLAQLEGRSAEKAQRIALILAVSDNPISPVITAAHMAWAVDYVRFYTAQTLDAVREHMVAGTFAKWCGLVLNALAKNAEGGSMARERGLSWAQLCKAKTELQNLKLSDQTSVMNALKNRDLVGDAPASTGKRGRPREAWVLIEQGEDE
jgi:hypothetical protein